MERQRVSRQRYRQYPVNAMNTPTGAVIAPPETHREPGLVILLRPRDERNHGQSRGHIPDRHHIPSRDPPRRKEIHHSPRILPRINRHPDQQHDRDDYNQPIKPFHTTFSFDFLLFASIYFGMGSNMEPLPNSQ